jgi:hypothetical protein
MRASSVVASVADVLFFRSEEPAGFLTAARAGAPFAVLTDLALATPLLGVDGAAPVPVLLGVGLGDVAPLAGELRPDVPDVGVFFGIVAIGPQLQIDAKGVKKADGCDFNSGVTVDLPKSVLPTPKAGTLANNSGAEDFSCPGGCAAQLHLAVSCGILDKYVTIVLPGRFW